MGTRAHKRDRRIFVVARCLSLILATTLPMIDFPDIQAFAASPAAPSKAPALNQELREPSSDWCAQYRLNHLSAKARLAEPNRTRLLAAQAALAPGFRPGKANDGVLLLADYQSEMEGLRPDRVLAATYLAVASAVPIDLRLVERVNSLLCVSASVAVAKGVALIANAEWREMNSAK